MDELLPMMDQLKERTIKHEEWEKKASQMNEDIDNGNRPGSWSLITFHIYHIWNGFCNRLQWIVNSDINGSEWVSSSFLDANSVESLLEEARARHYPLIGVYNRLNEVMNECKCTLSLAKCVLSEQGVRVRWGIQIHGTSGIVCLRSTTRNQRADSRSDLNGIIQIEDKLKSIPIEATELINQIKVRKYLRDISQCFDNWDTAYSSERMGEKSRWSYGGGCRWKWSWQFDWRRTKVKQCTIRSIGSIERGTVSCIY